MTFEQVNRFIVPRDIVIDAELALTEAGELGLERFVLWSGALAGHAFQVMTQHVPRQIAYASDDGLCVRVDGLELHQLNRWLFENGEQLAIQIHTHPTDAYHSDTDNAFAMVTTRGGLSIVVPWFAADGVFGAGTAVYRLSRDAWDPVDPHAVADLIEIIA